VPECITPVCVECRPADSASMVVGVGHIFAATPSGMLLWYLPSHFCWRCRKLSGLSPSLCRPAPGVGHADDEHPFAFVRGANVGSSQARPSATEPERGQVPENGIQSPRRSEAGDVFHDDDARS